MLKRVSVAAALLSTITAAFAFQDAAPPTAVPPIAQGTRAGARRAPRTTGKITAIAGTIYTLKPIRGEYVKVDIPVATPVMKPGRVTGAIADIKIGMNIGVQGPRDDKGVVKATRVTIQNPMVMGTVQAISAGRISVKAVDGKFSSYLINTTTRIRKSGQEAKWSDFKVGDQVMVQFNGAVALSIGSGGMNRGGTGARTGNPADGARQPRVRRGTTATPTAPASESAKPEAADAKETDES